MVQKSQKKQNTSYADAGVSIDAGDELVKRIKPFVKATARIGSNAEIGGFGGVFDLAKCKFKDPVLVSGTDGVGTKLKIAQEIKKHDTIGIDLVAMSVNDIIVQGAEPLFFLDYFACGKLDVKIATAVVKGIAEGCKQAACALIGGETAEMPGMYQGEEYDLAGFAVGAVERKKILPQKNIKAGDVLIAIPSSGLHSNGFSLARKVLADNKIKFTDKVAGFKKPIGEELLIPTKIYVKQILNLLKKVDVKAMAHITGGGITENLPRVLPEKCGAEINLRSWKLPAIFKLLQEKGNILESEMLRAFNCGVGMILVVDAKNSQKAIQLLKTSGEKAFEIGKISKGKGVRYN
ncbi:MAG TPA: phosphoribosylformylglycinamidine cyclo-ligase [Alphaproteobacteria bacterium]|nr:phosphoribosylformylglycinamidine cyclo-ligase [Alphaproteobacteria bacterium]